jgi:hypothetical protein
VSDQNLQEFARELTNSERRYAELSSEIQRDNPTNPRLVARRERHMEEMNLSVWVKQFSKKTN